MNDSYRPPNLMVGVSLLVVAEVMFFAGLVSAYLVARAHTEVWPPLGQPRLPVAATAFNSALLILSAVTMRSAVQHEGRADLIRTMGLGLGFVLLQGREWVALLAHGLRIQSGVYGAFFYTLVGAHALHVLAGLAALGWIYTQRDRIYRQAGAVYWWFVVALWPVLYGLVYLL